MTGGAMVPDHRLDAIGAEVTSQVARVAKTIADRPVTPAKVRSVALDLLARLRLVNNVAGGVRTLPALARYRNPLIRSEGRADATQPALIDTQPPTVAEEFP